MAKKGLKKKESQHDYLQIMGGSFRQSVKEGTPDAIERKNKNDVKVWELHFGTVVGFITLASVTEEKFGKELHLQITNDGEHYVIQTQANSGYAYGFFSRMENIDFSKEIEISAYEIPNEVGVKKPILCVYQGVDEKGKRKLVSSKYTKENPGSCPPMEKMIYQGKEVWDSTKRTAYFENLVYCKGGLNDVLIGLYATEKQENESNAQEDFLSESDLNEQDLTPLAELKPTAKAGKKAKEKA